MNTTIVPSLDPAYDYEVIQGIYHFKVRKDGTFMVEHEGDVFTYRFNSLGTGRGSGYKPFELGQADFSRFIVIGDTIRWSDVYPDIDLSVRYLQDILKVDVIVKNAFMMDLKAEVNSGSLNKDEYLTARFDIPQVLITSKAKQNGKDKDLYAEALDVEQPISFERNGNELHKLLPVEAGLLDGMGMLVYTVPDKKIHTAQVWTLRRNGSGMAEMSAWIEDLANLPEGDVSIDPEMYFRTSSGGKDTHLVYTSPSTNFGSSSTLNMGVSPSNPSDAVLLGFNISSLPAGVNIQSASVRLYVNSFSVSGSAASARIFRATPDSVWSEGGATWNSNGAAYNATGYFGSDYTVTGSDVNTWVNFEATDTCRALIASGTETVLDKGFYLKFTYTNTYESVQFRSKENGGGNGPELHIKYFNSARSGADIGHAGQSDAVVEAIEDRMKDDGLKTIRFFVGDTTPLQRAVTQARDEMKMILCFPVGGATSTLAYKDYYVMARLNAVSSDIGLNKTVIGIELGNEEDLNGKWGASNEDAESRYTGGQDFAAYYVETRDAVKASWPDVEIISGGSISDHKTLTYGDQIDPSFPGVGQYAKAFICGFIDGVTALTPNKSLEKLPDTMAIHGYSSRIGPEWYDDSPNGGQREWFTRINTLSAICNRGGYKPNMAATEYGFGAYVLDVTDVPKGVLPAPSSLDSATEVFQAVYYMRRAMMDATAIGTSRSERWKLSLYYHHPFDRALNGQGHLVEDYGWFKLEDEPQTPRIIHKVGSYLHNISGGGTNRPGLNEDIKSIWLPLTKSTKDSTDNDYYLYCGWITSNDERWGAIWRYRSDGTYNENYYHPASTATRNFYSANFGNATPYKFTYSSPFDYSNTSWASSANYTWNASGYYQVLVDENPVFLKFAN